MSHLPLKSQITIWPHVETPVNVCWSICTNVYLYKIVCLCVCVIGKEDDCFHRFQLWKIKTFKCVQLFFFFHLKIKVTICSTVAPFVNSPCYLSQIRTHSNLNSSGCILRHAYITAVHHRTVVLFSYQSTPMGWIIIDRCSLIWMLTRCTLDHCSKVLGEGLPPVPLRALSVQMSSWVPTCHVYPSFLPVQEDPSKGEVDAGLEDPLASRQAVVPVRVGGWVHEE